MLASIRHYLWFKCKECEVVLACSVNVGVNRMRNKGTIADELFFSPRNKYFKIKTQQIPKYTFLLPVHSLHLILFYISV